MKARIAYLENLLAIKNSEPQIGKKSLEEEYKDLEDEDVEENVTVNSNNIVRPNNPHRSVLCK